MFRYCRVVAVLLAAIASAGMLLGGCSSGGSNAHSKTPGGSGGSAAGTVSVDEQANGTVVSLRTGATLVVTLQSTYWMLTPPSDSGVLRIVAAPTTATGASCPAFPGSGCGTVTATYTAGHTGTTELTAHRDTCGEALRCVGPEADWKITVRVA